MMRTAYVRYRRDAVTCPHKVFEQRDGREFFDAAFQTSGEAERHMRGAMWFALGRIDGRIGVHEPPHVSMGARALSDYNIGHYFGEHREQEGAA